MDLDTKKILRIARAIMSGDVDFDVPALTQLRHTGVHRLAWLPAWCWEFCLPPEPVRIREAKSPTRRASATIQQRQKVRSSDGAHKKSLIAAKIRSAKLLTRQNRSIRDRKRPPVRKTQAADHRSAVLPHHRTLLARWCHGPTRPSHCPNQDRELACSLKPTPVSRHNSGRCHRETLQVLKRKDLRQSRGWSFQKTKCNKC